MGLPRVDPPDSCVPGDVDHGLESVFDNLMDSDEEWSTRKICFAAILPQCQVCVLQNRFSPLDESPIVREIDEGSSDAARRPLVDGAEVELPPSPRRRRPTRRLVFVPLSTGTPQSVQDRDEESSVGNRPSEVNSQFQVGSVLIDALQRDLEGPSVFPMTDADTFDEEPDNQDAPQPSGNGDDFESVPDEGSTVSGGRGVCRTV